jgi:hypothetical protein
MTPYTQGLAFITPVIGTPPISAPRPTALAKASVFSWTTALMTLSVSMFALLALGGRRPSDASDLGDSDGDHGSFMSDEDDFIELSSFSSDLLEREFTTQVTAFAAQDDLAAMRQRAAKLRQELDNAIAAEDYAKAAVSRDEIRALRSRDPAEVATVLNKELQASVKAERYVDAARFRDDLRIVRRLLPKFNLAGLWKGFYPNHGDVTVRLRYDDTEIYATKVEGGGHVPVGEVTFSADVSDSDDKNAFDVTFDSSFDAIDDSDDFTVKCYSTEGEEVEQFRGAGRVARSGFRDANFVPGRLFILGDDAISFIWLPLGTVVVFTRVKEGDEDGHDKPSPPEDLIAKYPEGAVANQTVSIADSLDDIIKQAGNKGIFKRD